MFLGGERRLMKCWGITCCRLTHSLGEEVTLLASSQSIDTSCSSDGAFWVLALNACPHGSDVGINVLELFMLFIL